MIIIGCSSIKISQEISDNKAYKLYRTALQEEDNYFLTFNNDSSYVICTFNDSSQITVQPITFLVVNLQDKEKTLVSINEYHKARWLDNATILLVRYSGIANFDRSFNNKTRYNRIEYTFNVLTKEVKPKPKPEQETF